MENLSSKNRFSSFNYSTKIIILLIIMAFPLKNYAQKIKDIPRPERIWVITHPFVAYKAWKITGEARQITSGKIHDPDLDGDYNGGQVDAFRHTLWMALLSQKMKAKKARKLGIAHEKGNEIYYKKHKLEDGSLPDSVACEMDLRNNEVGLSIGSQNREATKEELQELVKQAILSGKCWKISKNKAGDFLDKNNKPIPKEQWKGKWVTPKILVPSDTKVPE